VFDGHGGESVSKWLEANFIKILGEQYKLTKQYDKALTNTISECDDYIYKHDEELKQYYFNPEMVKKSAKIGDHMGSTAIVAIVQSQKIVLSNIGDSMAVIYSGSKPVFHTKRHKPKLDKEHIEEHGGKIVGGYVELENAGRIAMSRCIGDYSFKTTEHPVLTSQATTSTINIEPAHDFLVIACDGVWDFMTAKEVGQFIFERKHMSNVAILNQMFDEIIKKSGSDNITCIIVRL
jgi:serine/threonine protein phosphatase PrpC